MGIREHPPRKTRCEQCATMTVTTELFTVRDRNTYQACGKKEIETWNSYVEEAGRLPLGQEGA